MNSNLSLIRTTLVLLYSTFNPLIVAFTQLMLAMSKRTALCVFASPLFPVIAKGDFVVIMSTLLLVELVLLLERVHAHTHSHPHILVLSFYRRKYRSIRR
jgi:hypothetical protein